MKTVISRIELLSSIYKEQIIENILYDRKFPVLMKVQFPGIIYYELDKENYEWTQETNEYNDIIFIIKKREV